MPSDKRNSIMAIATGLISLLFNIASSRGVTFNQLQQFQCLDHGSNEIYFCSPLYSIPFFLHHLGDDLQYARNGFGAILRHTSFLEMLAKCSKSWKENET